MRFWNLFCSYSVSFCPALPEDSEIISFLRILGIDWPAASVGWTSDERQEKMRNALENCSYRETDGERAKRPSKGEDGGMTEEVRINLKRVMEDVELQGYDPTLGTCTGEDKCVCVYENVVNALNFRLPAVLSFFLFFAHLSFWTHFTFVSDVISVNGWLPWNNTHTHYEISKHNSSSTFIKCQKITVFTRQSTFAVAIKWIKCLHKRSMHFLFWGKWSGPLHDSMKVKESRILLLLLHLLLSLQLGCGREGITDLCNLMNFRALLPFTVTWPCVRYWEVIN